MIDVFVQISVILAILLSYFANINCAFKISSSLFLSQSKEDLGATKMLAENFFRCLVIFWIFVVLCYFLSFNQVFLFKNL
jgi:hypothetical protein